MNTKNELVVNGYCFGSPEDAETARQEVKKIEYLEEHMDYDTPSDLLLIYKKALENRVFQTPVGWEYLKELQGRLYGCIELDGQVPPITLYTIFANRVGDDIRVPAPRLRTEIKKNWKRNFFISLFFNGILVAAVAIMFGIALTGSHPNILNYEKVLQNRYSAWEQELSKREDAVREREREWMRDE